MTVPITTVADMHLLSGLTTGYSSSQVTPIPMASTIYRIFPTLPPK